MENTTNTNQDKNDKPFSFNLVKSCAQLGDFKENGNRKELNYISYNGGDPKWDIREWSGDHSRMYRGITLSDEELVDLGAAIAELLKSDRPTIGGPDRPKNAYNPWDRKADSPENNPPVDMDTGEVFENMSSGGNGDEASVA